MTTIKVKKADYPECSGNPASCPENEGYGCCMPNPQQSHAAMQGQGGKWIDGYPNKIYASEWFIAQTKNRERVVLTALPEEYAYDFKTADETYIKKENIVRWMQFPDSQFIPALQPPQPVRSVSDEDVEAACHTYYGRGLYCKWETFDEVSRNLQRESMRAALTHFAAIAQEKQS